LLAAAEHAPTHARLRLFSLTPDTSIPIRKNRRRDGRQEERSLVHELVKRTFPWFFRLWKRDIFQRNAEVYWRQYLRRARKTARSRALRVAFQSSVREEFALREGEHLMPAIRDLNDLELIAHFRNALAASA